MINIFSLLNHLSFLIISSSHHFSKVWYCKFSCLVNIDDFYDDCCNDWVLQDGLSLPFSHANSTTENARRAGQSNLSVLLKAFPSLKSHGMSITFTHQLNSFRQCGYLFTDCAIQRNDNHILLIWGTQNGRASTQATGGGGILVFWNVHI